MCRHVQCAVLYAWCIFSLSFSPPSSSVSQHQNIYKQINTHTFVVSGRFSVGTATWIFTSISYFSCEWCVCLLPMYTNKVGDVWCIHTYDWLGCENDTNFAHWFYCDSIHSGLTTLFRCYVILSFCHCHNIYKTVCVHPTHTEREREGYFFN